MATSTSHGSSSSASASAGVGVRVVLRRTLSASLHDRLAREVVLVAFAMLVYFGVRNATVGSEGPARENATGLFDLEQALGIAWEGAIQGLVAGNDALVALTNWIYIWGHWPVILTTAVALYLTRPAHYRVLRNAMFVSGAIGFLFFALMPVAPPRLLDLGLVDTVTERSQSYRALQPPGLTNQYAAFPSLHVGWNVLVGIVLFTATTVLALRVLAVLSPLAMAFAVVATANHFLLDVAGGLALVLVGLLTALLIEQRRTTATIAGNGHSDERGPAARGAVRRGPPGRQPPR
jgi:hypothetical protein